jgi:galactokinase
MDYRALALDFHGVFSRDADRFFFAPGRINLLGEYTEYCGGHVIPCAITLGIYGVVSKRDDRLVRLYSKNFPEIGVIEFTLDELDFQPSDSWGNYPKGMLHFFAKNGYQITSGFDLLVYGDLPYGAGLSSSASLLILTAEIIRSLYQIDIEPIELVEAGRSVENDYIGINCWFRDHYVVTMGKSDHALCIDCHTLDYRYVPLQLANYKLIIMHSNNSRDLAELIKQKRIEECEMALAQLQSFVNIILLAKMNGP